MLNAWGLERSIETFESLRYTYKVSFVHDE